MSMDKGLPVDPRMLQVVAAALHDAHKVAPDRLSDLIAAGAATLGASSSRMWLTDAQKRVLVHLTTQPDPSTLAIDGSAAGRAFMGADVVDIARDDGGRHVWVPMVDGVDCLGVLELELDDALSLPVRNAFCHLASIAASELVTRGQYSDLFTATRRRRPMTLAAELQWQALPPRSFSTDAVSVAGMLEPAYETGGDTFDYAHRIGGLSVAVFDAVGHDLRSSLISTLALGAYRNERRSGSGLLESAVAIDTAIHDEIGLGYYATGVLGRLDTESGMFRWVNGGHPLPLLIRDGSVIGELQCPPRLPFGLAHLQPGRETVVAEVQLEPRDAILFYTDGITEARQPGGEEFGLDRLSDFLHRAFATGLSPSETVRRLSNDVLDHHGGTLKDDATTLLLVWHPT